MSKTSPLVSVITVVYNNVAFIEKTINSVLSQIFDDFEYIIIDGGSTDGTLEIIKKYQNNLSHLISEKDRGIYDAMNKGVNVSSGKYCVFMNSGDIFANVNVMSDFQRELFPIHSDVVYGDVITVDSNGCRNYKKAENPGNKHRMYFCHQSAFASTRLLRLFPFDTKYPMSADFKFFKTCFQKKYVFKYVPQPVAIFSLTGVSKVQRIRGLEENMRVIIDVDSGIERIRLLLRIFPSYFIQRIRRSISQRK